jgi:hypothetical protein
MTADRTDTLACPMPASTFDSLRAASVNRPGHPHRWLASDFVTDAWEFVARAIDAAVAEAVSSPRGAPLSQQELVAAQAALTNMEEQGLAFGLESNSYRALRNSLADWVGPLLAHVEFCHSQLAGFELDGGLDQARRQERKEVMGTVADALSLPPGGRTLLLDQSLEGLSWTWWNESDPVRVSQAMLEVVASLEAASLIEPYERCGGDKPAA